MSILMAEPQRACLACGSVVAYFAVGHGATPGAGWCSVECWTGKSTDELNKIKSAKSLPIYPAKSLDFPQE